jgi:hypothetical protein
MLDWLCPGTELVREPRHGRAAPCRLEELAVGSSHPVTTLLEDYPAEPPRVESWPESHPAVRLLRHAILAAAVFFGAAIGAGLAALVFREQVWQILASRGWSSTLVIERVDRR